MTLDSSRLGCLGAPFYRSTFIDSLPTREPSSIILWASAARESPILLVRRRPWVRKLGLVKHLRAPVPFKDYCPHCRHHLCVVLPSAPPSPGLTPCAEGGGKYNLKP